MNWLTRKLIERAERTPYSHLFHSDGSPYMKRYWLMPHSFLDLDATVTCSVRDKFYSYDFGECFLSLRDDVRHLPACRLHNIITPDFDREFHNHPWSFISIVLSGGYTERRPLNKLPTVFESRAEPVKLKDIDFDGWHHEYGLDRACMAVNPPVSLHWEEPGYDVVRRPGSIAFRSYNDRHRIVEVLPNTWTLIFIGPKRQTWGFFTKRGFVPWREFESVHSTSI